MRTKSLREALMNLAEEAAELSAAAARIVNKSQHPVLLCIPLPLVVDLRKQRADVMAVWREVRIRLRKIP